MDVSGNGWTQPVVGQNRGLLLVDGDNIASYCRQNDVRLHLPTLIRWITPETTGVDVITRVCVFRGQDDRRWVRLDEMWQYCLHQYDRRSGEPGPADDQMFQEAWRRRNEYDTLLILSRDTDFAKFARGVRQGVWDDEPCGEAFSREVVLISDRPPGRCWRSKLGLPADTDWDEYADNWIAFTQVLEDLSCPNLR